MKYLLMALCCLATTFLSAETIGFVEYQLPESGWKVFNKIENDQGTTIVYEENNSSSEMPKATFAVNYNKRPTSSKDFAAVEASMRKQFPNNQLDFQVLEQNEHSFLYEWSLKDQATELAHGWGRGISTDKGTVVLGYQLIDTTDVAKARETWLPIIKNAKIINN